MSTCASLRLRLKSHGLQALDSTFFTYAAFVMSLLYVPGAERRPGMGYEAVTSASAPYAGDAATVPHQAYMVFRCMFAVITPALIADAFAERVPFGGFVVFSLLW
jgi:ammonia channel protein AmtB